MSTNPTTSAPKASIPVQPSFRLFDRVSERYIGEGGLYLDVDKAYTFPSAAEANREIVWIVQHAPSWLPVNLQLVVVPVSEARVTAFRLAVRQSVSYHCEVPKHFYLWLREHKPAYADENVIRFVRPAHFPNSLMGERLEEAFNEWPGCNTIFFYCVKEDRG